jgi:hypothetical protein
MPSFGMLRRVALVRTDVSEELSASIIRVTSIGELGTLVVIGNRCPLQRNTFLGMWFVSCVTAPRHLACHLLHADFLPGLFPTLKMESSVPIRIAGRYRALAELRGIETARAVHRWLQCSCPVTCVALISS